MMPFFNRNWVGACRGRWAGPRPLASGTGGCRTVWVVEDRRTVDLWALIKAPLYKNKEEGGSARAWPVAAPMPKSVSFLREKRECLDCLVLASEYAYLSPLGCPYIYSVCYSQFEGRKDSFPLDEI